MRKVVVKPREPRRKVLIRARVRMTATWSDVFILNVSSRGLQMQAARPPQRGAIVEIRRGAHVIIGWVAWAKLHRFGVKSQEVLFVEAIVGDSGEAEAKPGTVPAIPTDRRRAPLHGADDRNCMIGRVVEFAGLGIAVLTGATVLYGTAQTALATPLASVSNALSD